MFLNFVLLSCLSFFHVSCDRVVMTNNGPVQGITVADGDTKVEAFLGIPYAEPPVGRMRFQRPVPKTSWSGIYDASSWPNPCLQNATQNVYWMTKLGNMSEDCLYLNIWAPYSRRPGLKPVLVYFHGGIFNQDTSIQDVYDGTNLSKRGDIIVINFNYRLGIFGFFTSLNEDAVGNFGLYDQNVALKWIKANIKSFGGDPDNLVVMGNSAGSMSACGHLVSPLSRNIVKRAILQSGGAIHTMLLDNNQRVMDLGEKLARMVGCAAKNFTLRNNSKAVVNCMKQLPGKTLLAAEGKLKQWNPITFVPRVGDEFLPKPVSEFMRNGEMGEIDAIVGMNEEEGNLLLTNAVPQFFGYYGQNLPQNIGKKFSKQLMNIIFKNTVHTKEREIAEFYSNIVANETAENYARAIAAALGDSFVVCTSLFQAEFMSITNRVYFYVLTRRPSSTPLSDWMRATHFDEVQYVFGNPLFKNFTAAETRLAHRIMDRWVAFIKTGDPNIPDEIEWPLFTINNTLYLDMNDEEIIKIQPDNHRCKFWRDRYQANIDKADILKLLRLKSSAATPTSTLLTFLSVIMYFLFKTQ